MGKSTACLRIIACGGGSIIAANEAAFVDQTKRPKEKRGWSFKKKSSTSRVEMNPPIAETPSFEHKDFFVSERDSGPRWDEKSLVSSQVAVDLHIPDGAIVYEIEKHSDDANLCVNDGTTIPETVEYEHILAVHESDVIVIQDRKVLQSVIKLQAMIRGHLVRCHAVGALRCILAIAKLQVLVRARYAHTRKDLVPTKSKPEITYTSMTDLLKNSFARQLLESSPKSKPVKIKCDPLSRDSSWVWLERWMSLASCVEVDDLNARNEMAQEMKIADKECKKKTIAKEQEANITVEDYLFNEENDILLDVKDGSLSLSRESSKLDVTEDTKQTNMDALTLTHSDVDSSSASLVESHKPDILDEVETVEWASDDETSNWLATESEPASLSESVLQNARVEKPISVTYLATDYIHESQNEETEMAALAHISEFDLIGETDASSEDDIVINLEVDHSSIQVGESNCTVELDRSEIEPVKVELENSHESKLDTVGDELETELGSVEKWNSDFVNGESAVNGPGKDMVCNEKELATNVSIVEFQLEAGDEKDTKTNVSDLNAETERTAEISHQASPGSQVAFSESQVTPSSQVSISKKSKIVKKSGSIKKRTILSAAKRSPMNASSEKNSSERQHKKRISAKRRTSFGSLKPEVPDQELQRDGNISSCLPSYMQATKSARAKAKANASSHSPCSSPDIPDSFSAKDRQGSPRLSRNSSQTDSGSKSNGTSPLGRKWQR